jgi:hypothetical protein
MNDPEAKPIIPPNPDKKREIGRGVAEAAAELIPGWKSGHEDFAGRGSSKSETARETWQREISNRTNENTDRLDKHEHLMNPTTTLTGAAAQLAVALAKACPDGLGREEFDVDGLCKLLPGADRQDVEDATADLEALGLIERESFLGRHWVIRLTPAFYVRLDHQIMGWDTTTDAVTIARFLLERDASGGRLGFAQTNRVGETPIQPSFPHRAR